MCLLVFELECGFESLESGTVWTEGSWVEDALFTREEGSK